MSDAAERMTQALRDLIKGSWCSVLAATTAVIHPGPVLTAVSLASDAEKQSKPAALHHHRRGLGAAMVIFAAGTAVEHASGTSDQSTTRFAWELSGPGRTR